MWARYTVTMNEYKTKGCIVMGTINKRDEQDNVIKNDLGWESPLTHLSEKIWLM